MYYFDTSFLAPLVRDDETSPRVARFMASLPVGELAISRWTEVEFASLLARDVRMGSIDADAANAIDAFLADVIRRCFIVLLPGADDFALARQYLHNDATGLRAGDGLHLAIAGNHRANTVYSLDQQMIRAGKVLRLPVSAGIQLPARRGR